jgi:hypothetical protein
MVRWKCRFMLGWGRLAVILGVLVAASCGSQEYRRTWVRPQPPAHVHERPEGVRPSLERELYRLASRENARLRWDDCLATVAQQRAREMVRSGRFDHKDARTGKNPVWNLVYSCSRFSSAGENLVRGDASAQAMHQALMNSRTHRENLLNPEYQVVGIGCCGNLCVQLFAGY